MHDSKYPQFLSSVGPFAMCERLLRLLSKFFGLIDSYQATLLSLLYMYIMLQVVGLLWAFVTNAAVSLGLMMAREISNTATDFFVDDLEGSTMRKREILATFYVIYSTFRVVMRFLNGCVTTVWQSLNDFPKARRQIHAFAGAKVTLIFIATFVPIVVMSLSLIITGSVCGRSADDGKVPNQSLISAAEKLGSLVNVGPEPVISSLTYFCSESPFSYITIGFFLPRRILTLMVLLCTGQVRLHCEERSDEH